MNYQYSQEAQKRISAFGQDIVTAFIEEVPKNFRRDAYKILPRVQGFRFDSPAEFKEKQKRLIAHLTHPHSGIQKTTDWISFAFIWYTWARLKLGEKFPLGDGIASTPEAGFAFLMEIEKLFPDAEREIMEQLFKFSCFPDHANTQEALMRFQPAAVLARERMINSIKPRLEEVEKSLDKVRINNADVINRIDKLELSSSAINSIVEETAKHISQNRNEIALLMTEIEANSQHVSIMQNVVHELNMLKVDVKDFIEQVNLKTISLKKELNDISNYVTEWDSTKNELTNVKTALTDLLARGEDENSSMEIIHALEEKVNILEDSLTNRGNASHAKQLCRILEHKAKGELVNIHSISEACNLIALNLKAVGVVKSAMIARQIVATLIAGQLVQFSGSLANLIADAVAAAIGGPVYHEWRVPIGLMDGDIGSECIESIVNSSGCLLLKGANLSAFEIYGTEIRDIIVRRQYGFPEYRGLAFIVTWAQGPAAFPNGGALAELGPVFDTDTFKMRGVTSEHSLWKYGNLAKEGWNALDGLEFDKAISKIEELKDFLKEADFDGGNLWHRLITSFIKIIRAMPNGTPEDDLHFLLVSWAVPWANILGGPVSQINRIASEELLELSDQSD